VGACLIVTARVVANGIDEAEHEVFSPEMPGGPFVVPIHGIGYVAVGWHPVHQCFIARSHPGSDEMDTEPRRLACQDHPDGSVEVRLLDSRLGETVGLVLWMYDLPRHAPWWCQCGRIFATRENFPCPSCGRSERQTRQPGGYEDL
jgi:hypothetical protein